MVLFSCKRLLLCWLTTAALFVLLSHTTQAQGALQLREKAKLDDCYRVVGNDSVVFFYSDDYLLTPPGCAAIRRHVRLDSAGRFFGYVRDYRLANNQLLLQGAYRAGQLEGQLEVYHDTGELAARGQYRQGRQVGDWGYWYPSGKRRQVLSFRNGQEPLIQQFWNETGQQLVTGGNGTWYRDETGMRLSGRVVNGIPDGRLVLRRHDDGSLVIRETYAKGRFRNGVVTETLEVYDNVARLPISDWQAYPQAEEYVVNLACPPVEPDSKK